MAIILNTSAEEEARIQSMAAMLNLTPEQYLLQLAIGGVSMKAAVKADSDLNENWGADLVYDLQSEGGSTGYGDPSMDAPELARRLRERFSRRNA